MDVFGEVRYERQIDLDEILARVELLEREVERLKKKHELSGGNTHTHQPPGALQ